MFISESCISGEFDLDARMKGDQKALHCAVTITADQWSKADSSLSPSLILRGGEQRFLTRDATCSLPYYSQCILSEK